MSEPRESGRRTTRAREHRLEADVVVVGLGLAGAAAAVEAAETDPAARVVVLEKADERREGGSSRASGQRVLCVDDDVEAVIAYQRALNDPDPLTDDLLTAWARGLQEVEDWLQRGARETGMTCVRCPLEPEFPELPGASCVSHGLTVHPTPAGVWRLARALVGRRRVEVVHEARAVELRTGGAAPAVVAERAGTRLVVRARRGVVLACGGYENAPGLWRHFNGRDGVVPLGSPANTGDGVRMLQRIGADLWHMCGRSHPGGLWPAVAVQGHAAGFTRSGALGGGSWLELACDGRRFHDETREYRWTHAKRRVNGRWLDLPHASLLPVHMVFDETVRRAGPIIALGPRPATADGDLMGWSSVVEGYRWSGDNAAEVERGWIARAGSLGELAGLIGRDPERLVAEVERFNAACTTGCDRAFGRDPATMRPLATAPFYAVEIVPGATFTTGGGRRSARAEVLDLDGLPIPGLYEAGQLGSIFANLFQNGASLAECVVFGRIAGREAARRQPAIRTPRRRHARAEASPDRHPPPRTT